MTLELNILEVFDPKKNQIKPFRVRYRNDSPDDYDSLMKRFGDLFIKEKLDQLEINNDDPDLIAKKETLLLTHQVSIFADQHLLISNVIYPYYPYSSIFSLRLKMVVMILQKKTYIYYCLIPDKLESDAAGKLSKTQKERYGVFSFFI